MTEGAYKIQAKPSLHVYRSTEDIPKDAENTRLATYVAYGHRFSVEVFSGVFIHDEPRFESDHVWLDDEVLPRLATGGVLKYLDSPSLGDTTIPHDNRGPSTHGLAIIPS